MNNKDKSFSPDSGLEHAVILLHQEYIEAKCLPNVFPTSGIGETNTLGLLAPHVLGKATRLDKSIALAHMDSPPPWITWAATFWNARLDFLPPMQNEQ